MFREVLPGLGFITVPGKTPPTDEEIDSFNFALPGGEVCTSFDNVSEIRPMFGVYVYCQPSGVVNVIG